MDNIALNKLSNNADYIFSAKRYFINNLDSYHGEYILNALSKMYEKAVIPAVHMSETVVGEDVEVPLQPPPPPEQQYEIIGTVTDPNIVELDKVTRIIPKSECLSQMLTCGTVILDISCSRDELSVTMDYIKLLKELLEKQADGVNITKRYFILISNVMTWAATKPLDPDNPEMPLEESDFRKRRPHPNYKVHYDAENEVIGIARKYKPQIGALVVCTGVTYGGREDVLFYWFQKAWESERYLPLFGRGANYVPLINVLDLAQIIYNLVEDFPKKLYILAVEQTLTRQREIVKPLGRSTGSGLFKCIIQEDAFLIPEIDQRIYDLITLNLSLEPKFIVETMNLQWTSELPFPENVPTLMKQFKKARRLKPFKVLIYGPPIVGKTTLSKQVAEAYGLVYISPDTVAQDILDDLAWRVAHWDRGETADLPMPVGEDDDLNVLDDDDAGAADEEVQELARQMLAVLRTGKHFTEEEILGYLRYRLLGRDAVNRGWVLDGFPMTQAQFSVLFDKGEEPDSDVGEETEENMFEEDVQLYNNLLRKILPDVVVYLQATDDFICEKAMRQPDSDSRLSEESVLRRLNEFRVTDDQDSTPLNLFDEIYIHPLVIPVNDHKDYQMNMPFAEVTLRLGRPCRYAKLLAIIEEAERKEKVEIETLRAKESKMLKELEKKMQDEREEKMEYWSELHMLLQEEEEAALAAASVPMRNYLVQHIFPVLTPALLEAAKLRPEDPIDFLAEYLFKLNPTGKMLEPGYNFHAEFLLGKIKILDDALQELDIKIDPLLSPEISMVEPEEDPNKIKLQNMSAM